MADSTYTELKAKCLEVVKRIEAMVPPEHFGAEMWKGYRVVQNPPHEHGILYSPARTQGAAPIPAKQECANVGTLLRLADDVAAGLEGFIKCDVERQHAQATELLEQIKKGEIERGKQQQK